MIEGGIYVPIGLQCSVPDALKSLGARTIAYPFDWLWSPAATTLEIMRILLSDGIDAAIQHMTSGYVYCHYLGPERYVTANAGIATECFMNPRTGLGVTHDAMDDAFRS